MDLPLPPDFKEFLLFLNSHQIDYLLVEGYAVSYHLIANKTAAGRDRDKDDVRRLRG
jgi:hypothetical protein